MNPIRNLALGLSLLALTACGMPPEESITEGDGGQQPALEDGGATQEDGGGATDAGPELDAGTQTDGGALADGGTETDGGTEADGGADTDGGTETDGGVPAITASECFAGLSPTGAFDGPDYDQFAPVIGEHCQGTNHQDIQGIERVVFLGDSVTVGTPPTEAPDFYRSQLADALADRFGLQAPDGFWQLANPFGGTSLSRNSGDFGSCAKWGARVDDLMRDNDQVLDCFPPEEMTKNTLVVITIGGNDIASLTQNGVDRSEAQNWAEVEAFVDLLRETVLWLKAPGRFPNGISVVFANMYEFTDGTGDITSCAGASLAGYPTWSDPSLLADLVIWANEQFLSIAVETDSDMIFLLEAFCGHGFKAGDPTATCYRGPDAEVWFDLTCIHPNPTGHQAITDLFLSVIDE